MMVYVVDTFEDASATPVLEHRFYGQTQQQALQYFEAHLQYDAFLNAAQNIGYFSGMRVHNYARWEVA